MSVHISYHFNYPKDLRGLAADINTWIGCNLSPYDGNELDSYYARFLGMEFSLRSAEGYVNDGELDLENFSYQLGFRTPVPDAGMRPTQLPAILVVVYALHHSLGITGMLVYEVESLLARYVEREIDGYGRRLFDVLSETPFISFPAHLNIVRKRLRESWQNFYGDSPVSPED
ncbi:MAG TPA: hypothetical protein VFR15_02400 [Chloroflexia bacterium]|nr:hypothetical protein [Chloroflexia bacterium]